MSRTQFTWAQKMRYAFDNTLSRGPIALIGWLGLVSLVVILLATLVVITFGIYPEGTEDMGFFEAFWQSLMRTMDSGTIGGDVGWSFRIVMIVVTLGGIFILSTLIGILTSGIEARLDDLRKGRSMVIETGHTLILGWSDKVYDIVQELIMANLNQKEGVIVILSNMDKVEMEDALRAQVPDRRNTRIVCRSGSPFDFGDLALVNPNDSKSIIILHDEASGSDNKVIKTILALTNNPGRRKEPYHIIAEIKENRGVEAARLAGRDEVTVLQMAEITARLMVQTARQSGLSAVYNELTQFEGDEIYFQEEQKSIGKKFSETLLHYRDSSIIGIATADGRVLLNPPMSQRLEKGDKLIAISEDDDTVVWSGFKMEWIQQDKISETPLPDPIPERILILGWNPWSKIALRELDNYVAHGSEVFILAYTDYLAADVEEVMPDMKNLKIGYQVGDSTDRRTLDELGLPSYQSILVMCYRDIEDHEEADAQTIVTLLHIRDIAEKHDIDFALISEMLNTRDTELANIAKADDFVVGENLTSKLMAQVSENKELDLVFTDLFQSEGSEIYLKPVHAYVKPGVPVNFYTVVTAAARRNEVAIGYRVMANAVDSSTNFGVVINPDKDKNFTFSPEDRIIVLAEN